MLFARIAEGPLSLRSGGRRQDGTSQLSLLGSVREATATLLFRAQHATQQALRAVDWPAGEVVADAQAAVNEQATSQAAATTSPRSAPKPGSAPGAAAPADAASSRQDRQEQRRQQWRLLRFAAQDWVEGLWQVRLHCCFLAIKAPCLRIHARTASTVIFW